MDSRRGSIRRSFELVFGGLPKLVVEKRELVCVIVDLFSFDFKF
jgi:hypothetical protein